MEKIKLLNKLKIIRKTYPEFNIAYDKNDSVETLTSIIDICIHKMSETEKLKEYRLNGILVLISTAPLYKNAGIDLNGYIKQMKETNSIDEIDNLIKTLPKVTQEQILKLEKELENPMAIAMLTFGSYREQYFNHLLNMIKDDSQNQKL